jgi:glycosyltransferase involved in cell wall biosynthesis
MTVRAGMEVKRATGLPLFFTVHSTEFDRSADLWPTQWIADVERQGLRAADVVITVSERMRQQLVQRFGVPNEKIRVVPNAVDAAKFDAPKPFKKKRFWWKKIVLYHGRLSVQKGPDYFLRAAKRVAEKHADTLFVVSGRGGMLPTLVDLAIDLGIQNRVLFLGYLPEAKLPAVYAASDVYVLPSVSEPFGITALEAMASGKPVILSKTSGVGEFVRNVFRVDFWDVEKMAGQINEVLDDEKLRESLSNGAKAEAQAFSWRAVAEKTLGAYESVERVSLAPRASTGACASLEDKGA